MIRHIRPDILGAPSVPLSPGVVAGDHVYVSGQIASRPDGTVVSGDFEAEVELALDNVEHVLTAAGASLKHVVRATAYLNNSLLFPRFNAVYARRMPTPYPARTTLVVAFGHPDVRVEIDAVAFLG
jgi:2-iminobutanoate/2-iminopropanoate deaminase